MNPFGATSFRSKAEWFYNSLVPFDGPLHGAISLVAKETVFDDNVGGSLCEQTSIPTDSIFHFFRKENTG